MKGLLVVVFCVAVIVLTFGSFSLGIASVEPEIVYVDHYLPYPEPYPVIEERIVEVEKVVEVPTKIRNFESVEELEAWLDGFGVWFVGSTDGKTPCGDWALVLQKRALENEYLLNVDVITRVEYNNMFKKMHLEYGVFHAINSAVIGRDVYYIEPQNFEVKLAYWLE